MVMLREVPAFTASPEATSSGNKNVDRWEGVTAGGAWTVHRGDARKAMSLLAENTVHCIVTSPPYFWQRDYKVDGQIGLEKTVDEYVSKLAGYMDEARRVLRKDGVLFLNLGDTYYSKKGKPKGDDKKNWARRFGLRAVDSTGLGLPRKTALGMPWRVALEMVARGWTLRAPIIWKRNKVQPEPTAIDRPWRTHEMMFLFSKRPTYYFKRAALQGEEDIWTIAAQSKVTEQKLSAYFPEELVRRCLEVGCPKKGLVLDPFAGSGTVLRAAVDSGRRAIGIDLNPDSVRHMVRELKRISK